MKTKLIIAALITAAAVLVPANAAPILLTAVLSAGASGNPLDINLSGSGNGYIIATGYDGGLSGTVPPTPTSSVTIPNISGDKTAVAVNSAGTGLGLGNDSEEIGPDEYMVLDFADAATTVSGQAKSSVSIDFAIDARPGKTGTSYWVIYGLSSTGTPTLLADGDMQTSPATESVITSAAYTNYVVGILGDCELDLTGIGVSYGTPEPGTFMMGGLALIGFGIAMKKRIRKA